MNVTVYLSLRSYSRAFEYYTSDKSTQINLNQNGESILKRIDNRPDPLCNKWCHRRYIILWNISASVPRSSDGLYSGSWNHRVSMAKISKFDPKIIRVFFPFWTWKVWLGLSIKVSLWLELVRISNFIKVSFIWINFLLI